MNFRDRYRLLSRLSAILLIVMVTSLMAKSLHTYNHASACCKQQSQTCCCHNHDHNNRAEELPDQSKEESNQNCKICQFDIFKFITPQAEIFIPYLTLLDAIYAPYNCKEYIIEQIDAPSRAPPICA